MHLALDDHRVDPGAAVVDRDEPAHLDRRGAGIDVDDADVGAEREGEVRRVVADLGVQAALDALGQVTGAVRAHRDVLDGRRRRVGSPLTWTAALLPLQVGRREPRASPTAMICALSRTLRATSAAARAATPASTGCRRCPGRTASGRCRRARRRCRPAGCRAPRRRSGRTSSRGPGPGSAPRAAPRPCRSGGPAARAVGHAEAEDVHVLARAGADGLGEERDADAHQLAALALLRLLAAQLVVAGDAPCAMRMAALVVAGVVHPAGLGRVRELLGLEEVLQPQLGRVHLQLVGQAVDHPLDEVDRLGDPERAGVGDAAGRLVGVDARDVAVGGLEVVAAGEDAEEAGRVLGRLRGAVERAVVGQHVGAQREDLAVLGRRDLAVHDVVAGEARWTSGSRSGPPPTSPACR